MSENMNHDQNHKHDHDHSHDHAAEAPKAPVKDDNYWRSLEEYSKDEEYMKLAQAEFMSTPLREGEVENAWERRDFLKLMGASIALASASCTRRPVEKIVPYVKQPEEVTLGVRSYYSSTWTDGSEPFGMIVSTREGRPLKVEGNPLHPVNGRGLSARAQAHILSLYDPERFQEPKRNLQNKERSNRDTISVKWEAADDAVVAQLKKGKVALLTGTLNSPSTRELVREFNEAFGVKHYKWDAMDLSDVSSAQQACYGDSLVPSYRLDRAKSILSIDTDFLGTWLAPTTFARQFAEGRKAIKGMNRLIVFESNYSLTGANADVRVPIKPSQQLRVVLGLLHDIVVKRGKSRYAGDAAVKSLLESYGDTHTKLGMTETQWNIVVDSLVDNMGESLVLAGGLMTQTANQKSLQIAVNLLNSALENDGVTIDYSQPFLAGEGSPKQLEDLIQSMEAGEVSTLIIHGVNPAYASWVGDRFRKAAQKCAMLISTADRNDETARLSDYVLPDHHPMETWSDIEAVSGVVSIQQPTIRPLYETRSFQLSLLSWAYLAERGSKNLQSFETFYDYMRNNWKLNVAPKAAGGKSLEAAWDLALEQGFVGEWSTAKKAGRSFKLDSLKTITAPVENAGMELVLYPTIAFRDGSLGNVSWLHELPDPVTKIVWDNYLNVSYGYAEKESLKEGSMVEIKVGEQTLKLPIHIQPGLHDDVASVAIGYGRTAAGKVGNGIGIAVTHLAKYDGQNLVSAGQPVVLKKLGYVYELANVQGHHSMEGRQIVAEASLKEFEKNGHAGLHSHHVFSLWPGHQYNGHKWGMSIDLNLCNGCSACIVACQSENNIPVVGKRYVLEGREMHWLRVDRYFVGEPKNAEVVFQPLVCQQCDNAPCETVCPVIATAHNSEGLNDMSYNRCVGTRYCANNCPYKVRRFNWFFFGDHTQKPLNLALNPDVTVRTRGVMEKCTFCVHRIKSGKQAAKLEKRELQDGEIKTACQQSCPTQAIVFGDLNNEKSAVAQAFSTDPRAYALLAEFNAAPSVRYMTKIRNNGNETRFPGGDAHKGGHA